MVDKASAHIFFVCQQGPYDHLGSLACALKCAGCKWTLFRADENSSAVFDPKKHAGLIVLGGADAKNRHADNRNGYFREKGWLSQSVDQGWPVLGICLGAQLLALQCGGSVNRNAVYDVGWKRVIVTAAGRIDPLLMYLFPATEMYQSHVDTCVLPPGAVNLSDSSGNSAKHSEAFRIGTNAYGVQFHPEVTKEMLENEWLCSPKKNPHQKLSSFR